MSDPDVEQNVDVPCAPAEIDESIDDVPAGPSRGSGPALQVGNAVETAERELAQLRRELEQERDRLGSLRQQHADLNADVAALAATKEEFVCEMERLQAVLAEVVAIVDRLGHAQLWPRPAAATANRPAEAADHRASRPIGRLLRWREQQA